MIFECKIREKLKKEKSDVYVGDKVRLEEINPESNQAVITEILERNNFLQRPSIANIDQIIIIAALYHPNLDFIQLNRYLTLAKINNIPCVICINKSDLKDKKNLKTQIASIYEPLGYRIIFTSALTGAGIDEFKEAIKSNRSVLSGMSGVGKSSLLNKVHPDLHLKTKKVSGKTMKGIHTTRHVELLSVPFDNDTIAEVADTPGFSYLRFDNILPDEVDKYFDEIFELSKNCYYDNCLHTGEEGCNVAANLDKIAPTRYESYKIFVDEAFEYKEKLMNTGHKTEEMVKTLDTCDNEKIRIVKLGTQHREKSRRVQKQNLKFISSLDDAYYNNDDDPD